MPTALTWTPDAALPGFSAATLTFPDDYEGKVTAVLVKRAAPTPTTRAVLYIHGFTDYFFQTHLADEYNQHGYHFYALDLRKYGRALLPHQHPCFAKDMSEYFPEIDAALEIMAADGCTFVVINGHSTGCLTAALYAASGAQRAKVSALYMNSPFLDFPAEGSLRQALLLFAALGAFLPYNKVPTGISTAYADSLHKDYKGEWDYDLRLKPREGFGIFMGWARAIRRGQLKAQAGLGLRLPILVMHSDKSVQAATYDERFQVSDAVLNVEHMKQYGPKLGSRVTLIEIGDGLHDLVLSRRDVREKVFRELFAWLNPLP